MPFAPKPTSPETPKVVIKDFPGLITSAAPEDLPPGASVHQMNVIASAPGELRVRGGLAVIKFN